MNQRRHIHLPLALLLFCALAGGIAWGQMPHELPPPEKSGKTNEKRPKLSPPETTPDILPSRNNNGAALEAGAEKEPAEAIGEEKVRKKQPARKKKKMKPARKKEPREGMKNGKHEAPAAPELPPAMEEGDGTKGASP